MIPLVAMPPWLLTLSNFSPFKWGIYSLEGAVWRGFSASDMVVPCAILVSIGALCFAVGVVIFRRMDAIRAARPNEPADMPTLRVGELCVDAARREVKMGDRKVDLTAREFDLLEFFARHPGRVFRRSDLLDQVWGYGHEGYEHTVNSHINRLRAKIEDNPSQPKMIVTVWGVGYKFAAERPPLRVVQGA